MKRWRSESVLDLYNVGIAVVLFASPWLLSLTNRTTKTDFWIISATVLAISLTAIFVYATWEEWANVLAGVWLMISPWILGFSHVRAMVFAVGIGFLMAFLALLELWLMSEKTRPFGPPTTPKEG